MSDSSYPKIFPDKWRSKGDYGEIDVYSKNAVHDWFKQCMEAFPLRSSVPSMGEYVDEVDDWYDRWFSQFYDFSPTTVTEVTECKQ